MIYNMIGRSNLGLVCYLRQNIMAIKENSRNVTEKVYEKYIQY